jgi:hypothetical protein
MPISEHHQQRLAEFDAARHVLLNCAIKVDEHLRQAAELLHQGKEAAAVMTSIDEKSKIGPDRIGRPDYTRIWANSVAACESLHLEGVPYAHVSTIRQASSLMNYLDELIEGHRNKLVAVLEDSPIT